MESSQALYLSLPEKSSQAPSTSEGPSQPSQSTTPGKDEAAFNKTVLDKLCDMLGARLAGSYTYIKPMEPKTTKNDGSPSIPEKPIKVEVYNPYITGSPSCGWRYFFPKAE